MLNNLSNAAPAVLVATIVYLAMVLTYKLLALKTVAGLIRQALLGKDAVQIAAKAKEIFVEACRIRQK
ncbi:hypothetical protein OIU81_03065 [Streptomyces sp. NBC_01454]|uniref:hypothetical protein n=1 Tax=Streptomyces sp. NBC_01454 TaxID=2975867 RepID=UPI002E37D095|nr:hypothetical protein [Streptomyces sp. NBC_01454]